jgi:SAM-dependent methyltransferase
MDLITAGQCWHWFQAEGAARELLRILKPGGRLVIAHFDWLPLPGNLVEATESLILRYSPDWQFGEGTGLYPRWLIDVGSAGFVGLETFSFYLPVSYSHEAWVGRVRASAGIGATLDPREVERFSTELSELLEAGYPGDPLMVPHRVWALVAAKEA